MNVIQQGPSQGGALGARAPPLLAEPTLPGGCSGGSSTPFVGRTNTTIDGIDKQQNPKEARIINKLYSYIAEN